jgi:lipopolysaccharide transport system ATP-binding protein
MSNVIEAVNVSKCYPLRSPNEAEYLTLRDSMASFFKPAEKPGEFWALRNVSLTVAKGERVGIIGRNGAGKSTLLKLFSRITRPTTGTIRIAGRVASLLEVGTGFHGELTGRENIFLNGSIIGMSHAQIKRKFDDIVEFAEVEKFLDTPVKRYSSGMYVRLAFSVAAHMEPDVLIIDEVLAVGDIDFQRKCMARMKDVVRSGCTILFVSHSMAAIHTMCSHCLYLVRGEQKFFGLTDEAVSMYLTPQAGGSVTSGPMSEYRPEFARPYISSAKILNGDDVECERFGLGEDLSIEIEFDCGERPAIENVVLAVQISSPGVGPIGSVNTTMSPMAAPIGPHRRGKIRCSLKNTPLLQGEYTVDLSLSDGLVNLDALNGYLRFSVDETDIYGSGHPPAQSVGVIYLNPKWKFDAG